MEEAKSAPNTAPQIPKPPNTAQNLNASQAPPAFPRPPVPPQNKKRKFDNVDIRNSNYFKIRAIVRDLRPHFIEVLRTPDFRNSKAAHEIQKQMKLVMDFYKQMMIETVSVGKCNKPPEVSLPGESKHEQKTLEGHPEEKQGKQLHTDHIPEKSLEPPLSESDSEKKAEDGQIQGTYVVGGSNFGWNFILYPSGKPVYYGVTKEMRQTTK